MIGRHTPGMRRFEEYAWLDRAIRLWKVDGDQVEEGPLGDGPKMKGVYGVAGRFQAAAQVAANAQVLELLLALYLVRILGVFWWWSCAKRTAYQTVNPVFFTKPRYQPENVLTLGIVEENRPFWGPPICANTITSPHVSEN